jgi:hypothetical protein
MIYPAWTVAPSIYPAWLGLVEQWIQGNIIALRGEQRMIQMHNEVRLELFGPEFRLISLLPESRLSLLHPEPLIVSLPPENRLELLRKGIA